MAVQVLQMVLQDPVLLQETVGPRQRSKRNLHLLATSLIDQFGHLVSIYICYVQIIRLSQVRLGHLH